MDEMIESPRRQCSATNRDGERCRNPPIRGGTVCAYHGGKAPQTIAAAQAFLASMREPALVRLNSILEERPPCPICGRSDAVALQAIRMVLDRAGLPASSITTLKHDRANADWAGWLTVDELRQLVAMKEEAIRRMEAGEPQSVSLPPPPAVEVVAVESVQVAEDKAEGTDSATFNADRGLTITDGNARKR